MDRIPRLPARVWTAIALALGLIATIALWATGDISAAARLTAYATTVLALGTVGLAGGAIGTYIEQRKANQSQAIEIAEQKGQLERAKENDIAQVLVQRRRGPGEMVKVEVTNNSSRAIRFVYVWVSVEGITGYYHTVVIEEEPRSGQAIRSRRMQHTRHILEGHEISQCYRSLLPGEARLFVQYVVTNPQAMPNIGDAAITAHAISEAIDGAWWKCSEDGTVRRLGKEPPLFSSSALALETGLRPTPGVERFRTQLPQSPTARIDNPGTG